MDLFTASFLTLTHAATSNIKGLVVTHHLQLMQSLLQNLSSEGCTNALLVKQLVRVQKTINRSVGSSLNLHQSTHHRSAQLIVNQFLFMWQLAKRDGKSPLAKSILALGHGAIAKLAKGGYGQLKLGQGVRVSKTINLAVGSGLNMRSRVAVCTNSYCVVVS